MKKIITLSFGVAVCVFLFSNFKTTSSNFIFTAVNEGPELPDTPLDYEDVVIPDHLLKSSFDPIDPDTFIVTGYESSGIDSSTFDFLKNDVATLGRVLFYDEKLSALENISCASCHDQTLSFTENKSFSEGISAPTKRNSMHLNDIGWTNREGFFWDMKGTDLHEMIRLPLKDENEIGANMDDIALKLSDTDYYPSLFEKAFGDQQVTEDRIIESIVHFISSMTTFNSKFDQATENGFDSFTNSEKNGAEIFLSACSTCHIQGNITSFLFGPITVEEEEEILGGMTAFEFFPFFFNNGLPEDPDDKGTGEWNENGFDNLFKLPSLRNIELTAPYMHDGRFTNLDEVIDHYSEEVEENEWNIGMIPPDGFQFSDSEKEDLKNFLLTLTDETFGTNEKWSNPFKNATNVEELEITDMVVKPNPMDHQSTIQFANPSNKLVSMNVYNNAGQLVLHSNTTGNSLSIEKNNFIQGMYVVELIQDDKRSTRKLIVR